jgi:hypothetical protein
MLTGKLSDFAGLLVFSVFFSALWPGYKKQVFAITGLLFIAWKSPLSQGLIVFCNEQLFLPVGRVVDASDYWALLIMPLAWRLLAEQEVKDVRPLFRGFALFCIGSISIAAFCATSMVPRYLLDENRYRMSGKPAEPLRTARQEEAILETFRQKGWQISKDTAFYEPAYSNHFYVKEKDSTGQLRMRPLAALYPRLYFKVQGGQAYTIDKMDVNGVQIRNIQLLIDEALPYQSGKRMVRLVSFQPVPYQDSAVIPRYDRAYYELAKALRKTVKTALKK